MGMGGMAGAGGGRRQEAHHPDPHRLPDPVRLAAPEAGRAAQGRRGDSRRQIDEASTRSSSRPQNDKSEVTSARRRSESASRAQSQGFIESRRRRPRAAAQRPGRDRRPPAPGVPTPPARRPRQADPGRPTRAGDRRRPACPALDPRRSRDPTNTTHARPKATTIMDQLKDILKQVINYRFWIAVGVSALFLPMVAYVVGAATIQARRRPRRAPSRAPTTGSRRTPRASPSTSSTQSIVTTKTERPDQGRRPVVEEALRPPGPAADLARAGPRPVHRLGPQVAQGHRRRRRAGRDHRLHQRLPEQFVTEVYKMFKPYDPFQAGTGIVSRPPKATLLRPVEVRRQTPAPAWARSGRPRSGSGSSGPCWTSSPR